MPCASEAHRRFERCFATPSANAWRSGWRILCAECRTQEDPIEVLGEEIRMPRKQLRMSMTPEVEKFFQSRPHDEFTHDFHFEGF
jgi:hypothetical protein